MYDYGYGYDYSYAYGDVDTTVAGILGGFAIFGLIVVIISIATSILMLVSQWKIYKKAGKQGWECLIPVYNIIVLLQIVELPMWYLALFFVPFANIYAMFKIFIELAHKFGKSTGFGVLTAFFSVICLPILAFGKNNVYNGSNNQQNNNVNMQTTQYTPNNMNAYQNPTPNMENNSNTQQPFMFNQNINTEINPIPAVQNVENNNFNNPATSMNTMVQPSMPEANPLGSVTPNVTSQPMESPIINNQVNQQPEVQPFENGAPNVETTLNVIPGVGTPSEPVVQNPNNNNNQMM